MTEFNRNKIYRHKNMVDVAFLITEINEAPHDGSANEVYLRGIWLRNTGLGNAMHQVCADTITVKTYDFGNWVLINEQEEAV